MPQAIRRNQILEAVFNRIKVATFAQPIGPTSATGWVTTSRRLKLWNAVDPAQQPAMFLTDHDENIEQPGRGQPPKRFISCKLICYARCDGDLVGSAILNTMMDAIEVALGPDDRTSNVNTLGGLVYRCWIEKNVLKDPGDLDDQALLGVGISILWP